MASWWPAYIARRARTLGLDPAAVLSVASAEGLSGGVGDYGTSFGPFQLHVGGALPSGRGRSWAESQAGIDYALRQIAGVARGQRGRPAIASIVHRFERPAAPGPEVERAWAAYSKYGTLPTGPGPPTRDPGARGPRSVMLPGKPVGFGPETIRQFDPGILSRGILAGLASGETPDIGALVEQSYKDVRLPGFHVPGKPRKVMRAGPPPHSDASPPPGKAVTAVTPKNVSKWAIAGSGMDRSGMKTNPAVFQSVARIAQIYGQPLRIGTGSNHNEYVKGSNRRSDHWFGEAADIPMEGAALTRLGQAALIMAGMSPTEARKQTGGVFNVGGYNILFNTSVGGNHYNHLHVGLGRIIGRPA